MISIRNKVVRGGKAYLVPAHLSYGQYVIDQLRDAEDGVALINGETGEEFTRKQLLQRVVNFATALRKLGVKRGDTVAICSENRVEFFVSAVATICCGAVVTTANAMYTKNEISHVLGISRPGVFIASSSALEAHLDTVKSLKYIKLIIQFDEKPIDRRVVLYNEIISKENVDPSEYDPEDVVGQSDPVFILYSSGTTGLPKGVMISHLNMMCACFPESKDPEKLKRCLTIVPWYHAYGLMTTIGFVCNEKTLVYFNGFDPLVYLSSIPKYQIDTLFAVPPIVVFLGKFPMVEEYDMRSITSVWCGAAPLSAETIDEALRRLPNCKRIVQAYGMTETTLAVSRDFDDDTFKPRPGSGGAPVPGVKVKVVDIETREKLGAYAKGELCVKGPNVMLGYAGNKAATKDMFDDEGYLKTGDIGYYDEEGFFFIVDRLKELIKYKGHQVPPAEVESVLLQHPAVAECGVVGRPDAKAGELPTAFVVLNHGATATEQELKDFAASKLSSAKQLRGGVIFVDEVPKNPSGKILRRALKAKLLAGRKSKL